MIQDFLLLFSAFVNNVISGSAIFRRLWIRDRACNSLLVYVVHYASPAAFIFGCITDFATVSNFWKVIQDFLVVLSPFVSNAISGSAIFRCLSGRDHACHSLVVYVVRYTLPAAFACGCMT